MKNVLLISALLLCGTAYAQDPKQPEILNLSDYCVQELKQFPGNSDAKLLRQACNKVKILDGCKSHEGLPIFHYDKDAAFNGGKRILVFSLIHGDERPAGSVGRYWLERLEGIDPRNSWRIVPILNPDGVKYKTRTNANKTDINRNFPTKDWESEALKKWKSAASNPRRYPGHEPGSEVETKCALKHLELYKPDFVVSIHTPLQVLDFDGPKVKPPRYGYLPWRSLGHFPGSLGRYMWFERKTPVLTAELASGLPKSFGPFEQLQDVIGTLVKLELQASETPKKDPTKKKLSEVEDSKEQN